MNGDGLQRGIYSKLVGSSALMSKIKGVYADVPQALDSEDESNFPFVTIGQDTLTGWDTKTTEGTIALCQIDIWSRSRNLLEVKEIGSEIVDALNDMSLTIPSASHVLTKVESVTYTRDPDGKTKRGMLMARVWFTRP